MLKFIFAIGTTIDKTRSTNRTGFVNNHITLKNTHPRQSDMPLSRVCSFAFHLQ